jgi:microcystin-dependent protein
MAEPFVGEIRMFAGNFAPVGWEFCNGQLLPISENIALFTLVGTTYGGDGQTTFALPDLRGRVPMQQGTGPGLSTRVIGTSLGTESVSLTAAQMPTHSHTVNASSGAASQTSPQGAVVARSAIDRLYASPPATTNMTATAVGFTGGSQPHENRQPYLGINFIIAIFGIFPSQA